MYKIYDIGSPEGIVAAVNDISDVFDREVKYDERIFLWGMHTRNVVNGNKPVTIRVDPRIPQKVRMPVGVGSGYCPWFETDPEDKEYMEFIGFMWFNKLGVAHAYDFPDEWAQLDGFRDSEQMLEEMPSYWPQRFPNGFEESDVLTCAFIGDVFYREKYAHLPEQFSTDGSNGQF